MKKFYLSAMLICAAFFTQAQNFFFEDFDDCELPSGWTNTAALGDTIWSFGDNAAGTPAGSVDGSCMAYVHDDDLGSGFGAMSLDLTSPQIDLSSLDTALLQFDYTFEDAGATYFAVALWNGAEWDTVFTENTDPGCFGFSPTCEPRSANISIQDYLLSDFQMKFIFADTTDAWAWYIGLDNVGIYVPPATDAALTEATGPVSGCGLSAAETVSLVVFNNGQDNIDEVTLSYSVDGGTAVTETFSVTLEAGDTDTLDMAVEADLSVAGTYDIQAWADVVDDPDQVNDTITFTVENIPVISSLPYQQDFESGNGGWTAGGTNNSWALGEPATAFISTANSGTNAWVTNLTGIYPNSSAAYVESPCMDFSALSVDPVLRFAFIANSEIGWDGTQVEVSTDAGATWTTLGDFGEGTNWYNNVTDVWWDEPLGAADEWFNATHLIDGVAGESSVKLRFFFSSDGSFNNYDGFAFDDVEIFEQPAINAGVNAILAPTNGCGLGDEEITFIIENFGDADLVDFDVAYDIGAGAVTETITDTLYSAEVDTITFSTLADLSTTGSYTLQVWTAVTDDGDLLNDSLTVSIFNSPVVSSLPYEEDFETGANGWYSTGENGLWELGDPEGSLIDTANSGVNAWATNLDSLNYNNDQVSYLISPCLDFSGLVIDPILEFAFISDSEGGFDGMQLEVSTDGGDTFNTLGSFGDETNWYNNEFANWWDGNTGTEPDTSVWINANHLIDGVAGESNVVLRFAFTADDIINGYEGFAVDDISITEQPPVNSELTSIDAPETSCGLTASEAITVTVTNLGSEVMDSIIIGYTVTTSTTAGVPVTEVVNEPLAVNGDTVITFSTPANLSAAGDYTITAWTATVDDGDLENDTTSITITNVPIISSIPYEEDFENGNGGWTSGGTNSSWELGNPEGVFIDTANSGVNAWVTNLTGDYNNSEESFVESPCFDFSSLTEDPLISFAGIFETESCCDEGWVEVSTDGGATYTKLGEAGTGINWYNNVANDWYSGLSGAPGQWLVAENILEGVAGEADVKVRFYFNSDGSVTNEGFGLDDINIRPQPQLDLAIISMDGPSDDCDLDQESVTITFYNKGVQTVSDFEVGFRVDGGAAQTETYTDPVAQNDTVSHTFTIELSDLYSQGVYRIDVFTALAGDEDTGNDTLFNNEVENFGTSTPLEQVATPGLPLSSTITEGTTSELVFCGLPTSLDGCLEIEYVSIDSLTHTWLSDLDIYLISPAGDTVELSTDNGGSGDDMFGVIFTDTATADITSQTSGIASGYYATEDTAGFAGLYNGQDPNGAWSLWIDDDTGGDDGELLGWSMAFSDNSPNPVLPYSDTTICLTHVLTVEAAEYDSWIWSTGNNGQQAQLFGNVLGLGDHEVFVTVDQDGCTGVSNSFTVTVDACASIEEIDGLSIDIFPNPTEGLITVALEGQSDAMTMNVMGMDGKLIFTEQLGAINSQVRRTIDLSHLAKGMYFLRLENGEQSVARKVIVQ